MYLYPSRQEHRTFKLVIHGFSFSIIILYCISAPEASAPTVIDSVLRRDSDYFWDSVCVLMCTEQECQRSQSVYAFDLFVSSLLSYLLPGKAVVLNVFYPPGDGGLGAEMASIAQ